jgi:hypothetical protein
MPSFITFVLALAASLGPAQDPATRAQEETAVATVHLGDGTSVALAEWRLTYDFVTWKQKEPVSSAKPQVRENAALVLGRKSYPVKGDVLALTHLEGDGTVRVATMNLKKAGNLKVEGPGREAIAPDVEKSVFYQPRSLDISGRTLSGISRSFCIASFSPLVECGVAKASRVVRIDFN